jgi:hypothetical protein
VPIIPDERIGDFAAIDANSGSRALTRSVVFTAMLVFKARHRACEFSEAVECESSFAHETFIGR